MVERVSLLLLLFSQRCSKGKIIAFLSTEAKAETELKAGIDLGPVDEILYDIYDTCEPTVDNCFIPRVG